MAASQHADATVREFVDAPLDARSLLDFHFCTNRASDAMARLPGSTAQAIYRHPARVVTGCFDVGCLRRERLIASLAAALASVAP